MFSRNLPCFSGFRSSTFLGVNIKLWISPLSLIIRCSLNPRNHTIEYFPRSASHLNVLWIRILWLRQTRNGVESTKLMPVQVTSSTFLMKMSWEAISPSLVPQNGYKKPDTEKGVSNVYRYIPCSNVWNNGTTGVKQDKNNYNFSITDTVGLVTMHGLFIHNHIFFLLQCKFLAKIISHTISVTLDPGNVAVIA